MRIVYGFAEVIASFIEMFLMYRIYAHALFNYKRRSTIKYEILLTILGTGIIEICNLVSMFSYFTMVIFVLYTSMTVIFLYKINYIVLFSMSSFYLLCVTCIELLVFTIVSNLFGGQPVFMKIISEPSAIRSITIIGIKCLWILIYLFLRKYLDKISFDMDYSYIILIATVSGFLGFNHLVDQTIKGFDHTISEAWFFLVLILAFVIFSYFFLFEKKQEKMKLSFFEMRNSLLEENYKMINDLYMKNARLYHDLNNHLNTLYHLLDLEQVEEAKDYIVEIGKPVLQLSKTIWTGIDVVDVILNSKLEKAQEKGVEMEYHVEFPENTNIHANDICTILSNLLDNAIEAVEKITGSGKVSLIIRKINHFMIIKITNPCVEKGMNFHEFPATTKEDKHLHGWGLPSVKEAVEKYNGTIKYTNDKGEFIVTIMLFYDKV